MDRTLVHRCKDCGTRKGGIHLDRCFAQFTGGEFRWYPNFEERRQDAIADADREFAARVDQVLKPLEARRFINGYGGAALPDATVCSVEHVKSEGGRIRYDHKVLPPIKKPWWHMRSKDQLLAIVVIVVTLCLVAVVLGYVYVIYDWSR
jgi:hypothetical protein